MGKGKWSRWGRNGCEGWSLDVGYALRGQVARNHDRSWRASLNATELGEWKTREEAVQAVETRITHEVQLILEDWAVRQSALASKDSRSGKTGRTPGPTDTP
jgi:hypothetical protein